MREDSLFETLRAAFLCDVPNGTEDDKMNIVSAVFALADSVSEVASAIHEVAAAIKFLARESRAK